MLLAAAVDVVEKLAIPIGIALALIICLAVPTLRKGLIESFRAGQQAGQRFNKRQPDRSDENNMTPK